MLAPSAEAFEAAGVITSKSLVSEGADAPSITGMEGGEAWGKPGGRRNNVCRSCGICYSAAGEHTEAGKHQAKESDMDAQDLTKRRGRETKEPKNTCDEDGMDAEDEAVACTSLASGPRWVRAQLLMALL